MDEFEPRFFKDSAELLRVIDNRFFVNDSRFGTILASLFFTDKKPRRQQNKSSNILDYDEI